MQWPRSAIQNFQCIVQVLRDFMEIVYVTTDNRVKKALSHIDMGRRDLSKLITKAFYDREIAIGHRTALPLRDKTKLRCIYRDARKTQSLSIMTKFEREKLTLGYQYMPHDLL